MNASITLDLTPDAGVPKHAVFLTMPVKCASEGRGQIAEIVGIKM